MATFTCKSHGHGSVVVTCLLHCYIYVCFKTWKAKQDAIYRDMRKAKDKAILAGDARCDSVRKAKYGSYSLMNLFTGLIISLTLVQVSRKIATPVGSLSSVQVLAYSA